MKTLRNILLLPLMVFTFAGCSFDEPDCQEDLVDLAVTSLRQVGNALLGQRVQVNCVIQNLSQTLSTCANSPRQVKTVDAPSVPAEVQWRYSPTYSTSTNNYQIVKQNTDMINPLNSGTWQSDEMHHVPTKRGYYICVVIVNTGSNPYPESDYKNNSAVASFYVQ